MLILALCLLISLACGSSNEGTKVTPAVEDTSKQATVEVNDTQDSESEVSDFEEFEQLEPTEESKTGFEVFGVGDVIEVKDHTIRLNSIEYQAGILAANFTVDNLGDSDVNVSSLMSFSAKKEDGTKLDQAFFDCEGGSLDGSVLPSDKLRGSICWSGAAPEDGIKIYYEASLFGEGAIVWNAVEGESEPIVDEDDSSSSVDVFQVGDLIEVKDHTIRLNSVEYQGGVLVANFLVENTGDSDVSISSIVSFSAKSADGTKLETEIFDCDASNLDGTVLPGDRLRGSICWSGAAPEDGIKIYYEDSLFGEGAVVWDTVEGDSEPVIDGDAVLKVNLFTVGDVIEVNDHTVVVNEVTFSGNVMKVNFTIENQGDSDLNVSSMLSFSARTRDGSSLSQEIFDCGTSLDGTVLPSDKLKGDICWSSAASEDGIKVYYEADLFGEGAVVWAIE